MSVSAVPIGCASSKPAMSWQAKQPYWEISRSPAYSSFRARFMPASCSWAVIIGAVLDRKSSAMRSTISSSTAGTARPANAASVEPTR